MPATHRSAASRSAELQPGRLQSSAPYSETHAANMKTLWPRNTEKRLTHQKWAPNWERMAVYRQSSWPMPPRNTKFSVRRPPHSATSKQMTSCRVRRPCSGSRQMICAHISSGQVDQMKSTGQVFLRRRERSHRTTLMLSSVVASADSPCAMGSTEAMCAGYSLSRARRCEHMGDAKC